MFASLFDSLFFYEPQLCRNRFDLPARPMKPPFAAAAFRLKPLNVALTGKTSAAAVAADKRSPAASDPLCSLGPLRFVTVAFSCGVLLLGWILR